MGMGEAELHDQSYAEPLGGGLVRRWSTPADAERVGVLIGSVFRDDDDPLPDPRRIAEARLLMDPAFPYMTANDIAVVEDTSKPERPLVACTCLWRHTWSYAGVPFGVGRPEIVATLPDYRNRGLVRALFDMIHARSAAEGHLLQAITGIPYFYRQFGYEFVLDLEGSRTAQFTRIPEPGEGEEEACSIRDARTEDVPIIRELYEARKGESLVWHEARETRWRFAIDAWHRTRARGNDPETGAIKGRYCMILDSAGEVCGCAWVRARRWSRGLGVAELCFRPGIDLPQLLPSLLRRLREIGEQTPPAKDGGPPCTELNLHVDRWHPAYHLLEPFAPEVEPPYCWYVRIPRIDAFLEHVGGALEERLVGSPLAGHTGSVRLNLYRQSIDLRFERGRLAGIDTDHAPAWNEDDDRTALACPPLVFLQLLLGYRDVDELAAMYPDVLCLGSGRAMVKALFPKVPSVVEPLG
jgi:hypothetical protein